MKNKIKTILAIIYGVLGIIYILNPTAGVIELIPDNIPIIGNLDEAAAIVLVIGSLRHFGIDITRYFNSKKSSSKD